MFAGQMACEAFNFLLKRVIREERPKRTCFGEPIEGGLGTKLIQCRNEWEGLWHAFITRAIRDILLRLPDPLPPLPTRTPSFEYSHSHNVH